MSPNTDAVPDDSPKSLRECHVLVVGGGCTGRATAVRLADTAGKVSFVDDTGADRSVRPGVSTLSGPLGGTADAQAIHDAVGEVDVVLTLGSDSRSLFLGHVCHREFAPQETMATLDDPGRRDAFGGTGIESIPVSELLADHVTRRLGSVCTHE